MIEIAGIFRAEAAVAVRIARERGEFDLVLRCGTFPDQALEDGTLAVPESVFLIARVIPFFDAKRGGPAEINDGASDQLDPARVALVLEADLAGFARIQGIECALSLT
jgi:hypothetical protein